MLLIPNNPRLLILLAVGVAIGEIVLDLMTPNSLNVSIIFSIPLVLAGLARQRKLLWSLLIVLLCMTFVVYAAENGFHGLSMRTPLFRDRVLAAITMTVTAALLHLWTRALDAIEQRDRTLKEQHASLQAAYRDLEGYQQQIKRHNEELEQRRAEAEAASERKTILLASLSHDIRNPLTAITFAARAIHRTVDNAGYTANLAMLARQLTANTVSVANLVSDVLDFSAFELGRVELHPSDFALEELIREECRVLLPLAQAKGLLLSTEPMRASVILRTDQVKLGRVLANLIVNAIKYTKQGFVRVEAGHEEAGGVAIRVHDSGIGIASADRERIFDEFAQLHDPRSEGGKGYGLGLSICRRLITLMGGAIGVESSSTAGTVFILRLPAACVLEVQEPQIPSMVPPSPDTDAAIVHAQTDGSTGAPVAASPSN